MPGRWHDVLTGTVHYAGSAADASPGAGWLPLAELTRQLPVALLVRADHQVDPPDADLGKATAA
jgi:hypothetical protein